MSESNKAVFLSYASQDSAAALKICEALRAAGVEVWFDQNELVGGDAWDHKIRRQIKECALLIPIISAATQSRTEGYFRLEWRLADQRTHLMAKGRPFLLPVVIDDTRDAEAHVPDSFLEVQWTRLPGGETAPAFANRVAKLLRGENEAGHPHSATRDTGAGKATTEDTPATRGKSRPAWLRYAWAMVGISLAVFYGLRPLWRPARHELKTAASSGASASVSPARKLADQARALIDDDPLAVRENFLTAKRLGERAIELDPGDAEAYAVTARASCVLIADYRDSSPASLAAARSRAESAIRLAPDSVEAALALATVDLLTKSRPAELEQRLISLLQKVPDDRRILRSLQWLAANQNRAEDVEKWVDRAVALPGGDPDSLNNRVGLYWALNKYPQMAATIEQSLAQRVTSGACHYKLMLLVWGWGDLPAGRAWVEQMPASLLQEDRVAMLAYLTWYWSRQPDRALEVLQRFPRPFIEQGALFVSTDFLAGNAQLLAGHAEVAKVAYAAGLKAVNERLAAEPNNPRILFEKTRLLVRLGERAEAEQNLRILRELAGPDAALMQVAEILVLSGSIDEAIAAAGRSIDRKRSRWPVAVNHLRNDPAFDPLRADPRFQAIIAKGEAQLAELRAGEAKPDAADLVPAAANEKSIAVLPFENRSASGENAAFLADGIQEDLINALSRVPGLKVIARTAAQAYRGRTVALPQIATELRVTHLVEAGVQRAGDRVRINVQLIRASDGEAVWSERYDRTLSATNIFDLQESITQAVAGALSLKLGTKAGEKLLTGTTGNLAAYEAFLKGRQEWTDGSTAEAVRRFQEALRLDPNYALAHGALAEAYVSLSIGGSMPAAEAFPLARASAQRALELDDRVVQAYTALAEYEFHYAWNWAEAEKSMLRALAIDPNYATAYSRHASHLAAWGRFDEARAAALRSVELSPNRKSTAGLLILLIEQRFQEVLEATADQAASDSPAILLLRGTALFHTGHQAEGLERLEKLVQLHPDVPSFQAELGWAYAQAGRTAKAREILAAMQAAAATRFVSPLELAKVAAGLNDRDLAFAQLEKAYDLRDPNLPFLGRDHDFDPIRDDPKFREFLGRLKLEGSVPEVAKK